VPVLDGLQWTRLNPESTREAADKEPGQADTVSEKRYESYCNDGQRAAGLLLRAIPHAFVPASGKPACVFHHTLYARELLYPDATRNGRFNDSLSHKVVMIGSSFAYSNDLVFSPIHERIPGVYLHAMALDNLLTGGPEYTKAVELGLKGDSEHVRALGLVFFGLLGVALVSVLKERFLEVREKRHAHARGPHRAEPMVDEATIATIGLATGATPGSSEALATYPAAQVQVVVQIAVEPARRPSSTWTDRALVKAKDACQWIFLKTMEIVLSLVIVGVLLYVGQAVLNVAYLSAVHVALFSLVSEWLEWNRKLVDWLHAPEEDMS
jgi:CHASE2 domain